jgi:peptidyl-prolyl cis-trans isomerase D
MLQSMRERMQGIIAGVIVFLICITFAFWGIQYYLQARGDVNVIAKVNGAKITRTQLQAGYERARQALMLHMGKDFSFDQKIQAQLRAQVLQQLINAQVVIKEALELGFRVSLQQVDALLGQMPIFQVDGHFSAERFQQVLSNMLYSEEEFIADLEQRMIISQLQSGIIESAFVLPDEIDNFVKLIKQTRDIGYVIIPNSHFVNKIKISDHEVEEYYQQHQHQFMIPQQVSIAYLELSAEKLRDRVQVTPAEMQQFYQDNIDLYSHPESWQVARIFVALPNNADENAVKQAKAEMSTLVKQAQFSKPSSLMQGQISQIFVDELQKLKVGQTSNPIRTPEGLYVIKLLQTQKAQVDPFSKVEDKVKDALVQQKTTQLFDQENDKLSDLTYTHSDTLDIAAKQLDLPIQTSDLFTDQGEKSGLLANPKVVKAAFSDAVLKQNYNSDPIEVKPGQVIVLRVKQHVPPGIKQLSEVESIVQRQLIAERAGLEAEKLGKELLADVKRGQVAKEVVNQQGLKWNTVNKVDPRQSKIDRQIINAAFNLPLPQSNKPETTGINLDNGDYALVQITEVYSGNVKQLSKEQLQRFENAVALNFGQADYELYTNKLIVKAKIKKFAF